MISNLAGTAYLYISSRAGNDITFKLEDNWKWKLVVVSLG